MEQTQFTHDVSGLIVSNEEPNTKLPLKLRERIRTWNEAYEGLLYKKKKQIFGAQREVEKERLRKDINMVKCVMGLN